MLSIYERENYSGNIIEKIQIYIDIKIQWWIQ